MEWASRGSALSSRRASVVLPPPEGDDRIKQTPRLAGKQAASLMPVFQKKQFAFTSSALRGKRQPHELSCFSVPGFGPLLFWRSPAGSLEADPSPMRIALRKRHVHRLKLVERCTAPAAISGSRCLIFALFFNVAPFGYVALMIRVTLREGVAARAVGHEIQLGSFRRI